MKTLKILQAPYISVCVCTHCFLHRRPLHPARNPKELVLSEGVLAGRLAGHAAEDHAVQQGVATQTLICVARAMEGYVAGEDELPSGSHINDGSL